LKLKKKGHEAKQKFVAWFWNQNNYDANFYLCFFFYSTLINRSIFTKAVLAQSFGKGFVYPN